MSKPFTPKVVTANDLLEGDVIYLTALDNWTRILEEAEILTDEADADLRLLFAQGQHDRIVGAYLAEIHVEDGTPEPTHFREEFRTKGPSNYNHGKQAERV